RRPERQPARRRLPLPATPGPLAYGCPPRGWFGRLGPPLVAGGALLAMAVASLCLQTQTRHSAERQRLAEHVAFTAIVADASMHSVDSQRLITAVSSASWSLSDRDADAAVLRSFAGSGVGGRNYVWALAGLDGHLLAAEPPSLTLPIGPDDPAWRAARAGRAGNSPVMNVDGLWRDYVTVPVLREGRPAAVVVIGESLRDSPNQANLASSGTLGFVVGGLSVVDAAGTVMFSWNPGLIGQRLVAAASLAALRVGEARQIDDVVAGGQVTIASPLANLPDGGYVVFQQPVQAFYGDIRSGRLVRDGSLLAVVAAALVGLTVLNGRREAAIRDEQRRLQALLHNAHDIVIATRADGKIIFVSSAAALLLGVTAGSYLGRHLPDVAHPDDAGALAELLRQATGLATGGSGPVTGGSGPATSSSGPATSSSGPATGSSGSGVDSSGPGAEAAAAAASAAAAAAAGAAVARDVRLSAAGGGHRWFDIEAIDLRDRSEGTGILLTCHEIGERRVLQDELRYQASHDALTGLPNRSVFARRLDEIAAQRPASAFAVLFIDLDRFKSVNDTYGHNAGDEVLRIIGARLRDAGTERDAVCRLGGDEFAVILGDADSARARDLADQLLVAIRRPITVGGRSIAIDATIGVALSESQDAPPGAVVRSADLAMYRAKEAGRERPEARPEVLQEARLEARQEARQEACVPSAGQP
ncbi:sensor domain-containing diguanylate cyclase, partial [Frankia sp. CiP1_Cm_nod1]